MYGRRRRRRRLVRQTSFPLSFQIQLATPNRLGKPTRTFSEGLRRRCLFHSRRHFVSCLEEFEIVKVLDNAHPVLFGVADRLGERVAPYYYGRQLRLWRRAD